jgi:hypothetical protein
MAPQDQQDCVSSGADFAVMAVEFIASVKQLHEQLWL